MNTNTNISQFVEWRKYIDATSPHSPLLPPAPTSIPHLFNHPPGCHGGQHQAVGDTHTGGSFCNPDVLIPWSPATLTGSKLPAKWPPLVALPVPMLPHRKEGCGLLSTGVASPPHTRTHTHIRETRSLIPGLCLFVLAFYLILLFVSFCSHICQHSINPIFTCFIFSIPLPFLCLCEIHANHNIPNPSCLHLKD